LYARCRKSENHAFRDDRRQSREQKRDADEKHPSATCCSAAERRPCAIAKMPATSTQYSTKEEGW